MEKIGIENIKLALEAIINIINKIRERRQPLEVVLLSVGKVVKIKFKAIGKEIKDLDPLEREDIVDLIVSMGFPKLNAEKVVTNLSNGTKLRPIAIAKELLK
jgi:hypothetical protein